MDRIEEIYNELAWVEAEGFERYLDGEYVILEAPKLRFKVSESPVDEGYFISDLCMKVAMPNKGGSIIKPQLVCFSTKYHDYSQIEVTDIILIGELLDLLPTDQEEVYYPEHDMYDIKTDNGFR